MLQRRSTRSFVVQNVVVWLVMTAILVVVPDTLEPFTSLQVSRIIGWAVGYGVWVVAVEQAWRERFGPFARFFLQLALWISAAFVAMWVSEHARP